MMSNRIEKYNHEKKSVDYNKLIFIFIIILGAFHQFNGTKGYQYLLYNEFYYFDAFKLSLLSNHNIINSNFFLPILKFLKISLNNDFVSFAFYILFGLFSIYCLIKLLEEFFEVKDPYAVRIIVIPLLFTNHFLLDYLPASIFIYHMNTATSITTQLVYPLALFTLRKRWSIYALISSIMILTHFTVAWLPVLISSAYCLFINKKKLINCIWTLVPFLIFLNFFIFNNNFDVSYNYKDSLYLLRELFYRVGSEGILNEQPLLRIIILYVTFGLSLFYIKKINSYDLKIYLLILLTLSLTAVTIGTIWTWKLYIIYPKIQIGLLYFARAMATYNMFFCLGLLLIILNSRLSLILKFALICSIYVLGKTYFSINGMIIASLIIIFSFFINMVAPRLKINNLFKDRSETKIIFLFMVIFYLLSHLYFINKYRVPEFDLWQFNNLNKWTNGHLLSKSSETKNSFLSLRDCDDFNLLPLDIDKNNMIKLNYYINYLTYKSPIFIENSMLYGDIDAYRENKKNRDFAYQIINDLNNSLEAEDELKEFIISNKIHFLLPSFTENKKNYFSEIAPFSFNISNEYILLSQNKDIVTNLVSCANSKT